MRLVFEGWELASLYAYFVISFPCVWWAAGVLEKKIEARLARRDLATWFKDPVKLADMVEKYPTVEADECEGCGNRWAFQMTDRLRCTTCGRSRQAERTWPPS
jgi:hypothetical protein